MTIAPSIWEVAVSGDYAYLGGSRGLDVVDVSNPTNPVLVGHANSSPLTDVKMSGHYAYAASDIMVAAGGGLRVFDVANPTNPVAGYRTNGKNAGGIVVSGNYAFLSASAPIIYDIFSPTNPIVAGNATLTGPGYVSGGVAVSGNYLYQARTADGLRVYLLIPRPRIDLTVTNTVLISWPMPLTNSFVLQQTFDLPAYSWLDITNAALLVSNRSEVVLPLLSSNAFYRLKYPQ